MIDVFIYFFEDRDSIYFFEMVCDNNVLIVCCEAKLT